MAPPSTRRHHERKHRHHHRKHKGKSKKPDMDTLPEVTETDDTVLDVVKSTYNKRSSDSDDGETEGMIIFKARDNESQDGVPELPSFSDSSLRLPSYTDTSPLHLSQDSNPLLDKSSKQLSERDKTEMANLSRWRAFSVESYSPKDDAAETIVEIRDPWAEDSSSPPSRAYIDDIAASKFRERTYSMETGF